ncbi:hypothetical protein UFOVP75_197 [uncultured Caudovirales phage]|uniref:Uncharacterized protein n=1 Tax=uncultured Caudovirales phage TaxID=2100421 RepID=A0A6J5L6B6_9CAUD|nr:hypothetical protein UFOVP75_197 [uncultured Caudovirales phage]
MIEEHPYIVTMDIYDRETQRRYTIYYGEVRETFVIHLDVAGDIGERQLREFLSGVPEKHIGIWHGHKDKLSVSCFLPTEFLATIFHKVVR